MEKSRNGFLSLAGAIAVAGLLAFDSEMAPIQFQGKSYKQISSLTKFSFKAQIDTSTLISQVMEFEVKPGAVSIGINVVGGTEYLYIYELINPAGERIIDPASVRPAGASPNARPQIFSKNPLFPEVFRGILSAIVPNNPNVKVIPGKWKLRIASESLESNSPAKDVFVVIKGCLRRFQTLLLESFP